MTFWHLLFTPQPLRIPKARLRQECFLDVCANALVLWNSKLKWRFLASHLKVCIVNFTRTKFVGITRYYILFPSNNFRVSNAFALPSVKPDIALPVSSLFLFYATLRGFSDVSPEASALFSWKRNASDWCFEEAGLRFDALCLILEKIRNQNLKSF